MTDKACERAMDGLRDIRRLQLSPVRAQEAEYAAIDKIRSLFADLAAAKEREAALITALETISHMHNEEALVAIAALFTHDPSRRAIVQRPLPVIDTTIKPPARYYPERQS